MCNYLIIPNCKKEVTLSFAKEVITFLYHKNHQVFLLSEANNHIQDSRATCISNAELGKMDIAIILGGDGTVIRAVRYLQDYDIPIFGINFGHLGYLTECEPKNAFESLHNILESHYQVEKRVLLEGSLIRENQIVSRFICFNEAVVHRGALSRLLRIKLEINRKSIETFLGDGILVATPTGSTAYNLSCGGPILTPDARNFVITPICTHSISGSSIVIPDNDEINLYIQPFQSIDEDIYPLLTIDSFEKYLLQANDRIHLKRAKVKIKTIKIQNDSFYSILQQKRTIRL